MLTAHLLSMFIANVPVTAMLLPIAEGLLQKLKENIASSKLGEEVQLEERNYDKVNSVKLLSWVRFLFSHRY